MKKYFIVTMLTAMLFTTASAEKKSVFLYAGQSNADGREYVVNLPSYMKEGTSPYSPYTHLKWANICGNPAAKTFGKREMANGERYAFCDVTNYWIDQSAGDDFYAIKCAYGGTAIAPGVTAAKLPIWYADAEWMTTHYAYKGDDITQEAYKNYNSLTKNLTEGFASLVDGTLAAIDEGYDVKAIMWNQGESDRQAAGSYYTNFKTMIGYMRQAIYEKTGDEADKTLPFIFGTVCRRSTQYNATVEKAQRQVADEDPNVYLIDMKDATLLSDNLHFDRQATEYLGKSMYNILIDLGLAKGSKVAVDRFPTQESVMDKVVVPVPDNRFWDFSSFSESTKNMLAADVALTSGALWNTNSGWGYRRSNGISEEELHVATGNVITETQGLYFSSAQGNRVTLNTSNGFLGFVTGDPTMFIPKLTAGQLVNITVRGNKETVRLKPGLDMDNFIEVVGDDEVGTSYGTITFRVRHNVTVPTHIGIGTSGPAFIRSLKVETPETVNILIGADQKETFVSEKALDLSPFADLFKAYVITGYDNASATLTCEQVSQVPARTPVLLMGVECTVNAPVIEGGIAPLPYTNLLMPVVGNGSAPAGSFVLTTSHGTTQFTKTTNAVSLENQAYLMLPEATKEAYGFQINKSREEKTYVITSIFDKGTTLTLSDQLHHTIVDGSTSKGVYLPTNAAGLEDNFAFDNSGLWQTDGKNGSLGQTYKSTIYCSVLSLENGDRVKFDLTSNCVLKAVQNGILDGVKADDTLISGTTYTVSIAEGSTVNIDLKMTATSNRNGFTKITLWKAPATPTGIKALVSKKRKDTALYDLTGRQLQAQPRNGIYIKNGRKMMVTR